MHTDAPFLITIPTRPGDRQHVPDGWSTLQIGRDGSTGDADRVGLVCFDPLTHDLAVWLSECTIAHEMATAGWLRAFTFGTTSVWYRPADAASVPQQAA